MKLKPIEEQVVVIVGASSGIGRATALKFAERGARLVVTGRNQAEMDALIEEIRGRGAQVVGVVADVSSFEQVRTIGDRAVANFGRIDTWVHSAAVMMHATFADTTPEEFQRIIDVNLMGQVYGAMVALPHLKREGRGALIHISSAEAQRSLPFQSAYAASKHALVGFLNSLRMEVEQEGFPIQVTNILPTSINTPLYQKSLTKLGVRAQPVAPVYQPELVADAIVYVAENPCRDVYVGGAGAALTFLQRLSPALADVVLRRMAHRMQHTALPKSPGAPDNLFWHLPGYDTTRGDLSDQAKPFSLYNWLAMNPVMKWSLAVLVLASAGMIALNRYGSRSQLATMKDRLGLGRSRSRLLLVRLRDRLPSGRTRSRLKSAWLRDKLLLGRPGGRSQLTRMGDRLGLGRSRSRSLLFRPRDWLPSGRSGGGDQRIFDWLDKNSAAKWGLAALVVGSAGLIVWRAVRSGGDEDRPPTTADRRRTTTGV